MAASAADVVSFRNGGGPSLPGLGHSSKAKTPVKSPIPSKPSILKEFQDSASGMWDFFPNRNRLIVRTDA